MPTGNEGLPHNAHCPFNNGKNKRIINILLDKVVILLNMNLVNYKLSPPDYYDSKKKMLNHTIYSLEKKTEIVPDQFKPNCINPEIFLNLKTKLRLESVLLLDRTYPKFKSDVCIIDHINRSGYNFLIGKTPFKDKPRFPDMSNIYQPLNNLDKVIVHTVGPEKFLKIKDEKVITSESVGLISPIWHYIGVKVFSKNINE